MEFFLKWLALASVQTAATMSPGPAFVMTVRNAVSHGRVAGICTALGLGLGVGAHVIFVMAGLSVIVTKSVLLYEIIKYVGAAYLIFIGIQALMSKKSDNKAFKAQSSSEKTRRPYSPLKAIWVGFLTNLLNPKAVIFFTAVFAQFVSPDTALSTLILYASTSIFIEITWFSILATVLTNQRIKQSFLGIAHWIDRVCGGLMIALGVRLALSKA